MNNALNILKEIESYGYEAYIIGGYVRDYLLNIKSNDVDITTNATPKQIREIFLDSCLPGEDYGSVEVKKKTDRYQITTYRKDIGSIKNRKPLEIEYVSSLKDDLSRRDFTINTICMDSHGKIIDLLNGKDDLDKKIIRCVGKPNDRFNEDALRILRAIRFATILDFKLDDSVRKAIIKNKKLLGNLSYNRKKDELEKIFTSSNALDGIKLILDLGLDKALEIKNLDKVKIASSSISIWSQLDISSKYPFTNNEKDIINDVKLLMNKDNLDPFTLYYYGLYVNSIAGEIKGLDIKEITEKYASLPIKRRQDIDIEITDITNLFDKKPGPYLKEIFEDIEKELLYSKLENKNDIIIEYIKNKYCR